MLHKYNFLLIRNISTTCNTDYSYNGYRILQKIKNTNWIHHTKLTTFTKSNFDYIFTNSSALYNGLVKSTGIWLAKGWTVLRSNPGRAIFSASVQTRPGANPASCTMCSGSVSRGKRSGSSVDHPPPSSTNVKDRVPLLPSGPSRPVLWWPLPFTFNTSYLNPGKVFFRPTQNSLAHTCWGNTIIGIP